MYMYTVYTLRNNGKKCNILQYEMRPPRRVLANWQLHSTTYLTHVLFCSVDTCQRIKEMPQNIVIIITLSKSFTC